MKNQYEIGKIISEARKDKKITQQQLANKLNVTDKAISNWETGKNYPDIAYINEIEKILDINIIDRIKKENRIKKIIIPLLVIVIGILAIVFQKKDYSLYFISEESNYIIEEAYIISNKEDFIISINNIFSVNDTNYNFDKISLFINDVEIISVYNGNSIFIHDSRKDPHFLKGINKINKVYLLINNNGLEETINLVEKKIDIDENQAVLLKNNGFKEVGFGIYEKEKNHMIFKYNMKSDVFYSYSINDKNEYYCIVSNNAHSLKINEVMKNKNINDTSLNTTLIQKITDDEYRKIKYDNSN